MADQKPAVGIPLNHSKYSQRVLLKTILERSDGGSGILDQRVVIGGWVKSEAVQKQPSKKIMILNVSDGSCVAGLQIVVDPSLNLTSDPRPTGTCILAEGTLKKPSTPTPGKHPIELIVEKFLHIGTVDPNEYPLSTKRVLEELGDWSHFRPRTTTVGSVTRIRSALTFAVHSFFQSNGFFYVEVPTITTTCAEGFGKKFFLATLANEEQRHPNKVAWHERDDVKNALRTKSSLVDQLNRTKSVKDAFVAAKEDLEVTKGLVPKLQELEKSESEESERKPSTNVCEDFFPRRTYLTVSGRSHLGSYVCDLGQVYSCGPRFRADRMESSKQSAEMWMVETEIAFSQMEDVIKCADDLLKFLCRTVLEDCSEDLKFVNKRIDQSSMARLQSTISSSFEKISYQDAWTLFNERAEKTYEKKIEFGAAFTDEQLSVLAEIYQKPRIICDYPKEAKPFYVRLNDDKKTVAAFDLVVPKAGRIISGSQNEERLDKLEERSINQLGLPKEEFEWCLQLREHGTAEHSGFSLSLDSFLVFATGLSDVRELTPFPRSYRVAKN